MLTVKRATALVLALAIPVAIVLMATSPGKPTTASTADSPWSWDMAAAHGDVYALYDVINEAEAKSHITVTPIETGAIPAGGMPLRAAIEGKAPAFELVGRDKGAAASLLAVGDRVCLATTRGGSGFIACGQRNAKWKRVGLPAGFDKRYRLVQIVDDRGKIALLASSRRARGFPQVFIRRGSAWRSYGPPLRVRGALVSLVRDSRGAGPLTVLVTKNNGAKPTRTLLTLQGGKWEADGRSLSRLPQGPVPFGPVRTQGETFVPVTNARSNPWSFRVFEHGDRGWRSTTRNPLSDGEGNAQGSVDVSSGSVWALWQEHKQVGATAGFDTDLFLQRVSPRGAAQRVWAGESAGPANMRLVNGTLLYYESSGSQLTYQPMLRRVQTR